jgi:predicted  nucleic acid-binding Zn-ribbon protein
MEKELSQNWMRGHRSKNKRVALTSVEDHLAISVRELRSEIAQRENRQREIEQEIGTNRQKIVMLRQSLQALQAIQGSGALIPVGAKDHA